MVLALSLRVLAPFLASLLAPGSSGAEFEAGRTRPALWVADRDGDALFGLDEDLYFRSRRTLRRPVALCSGEGGAVWVLCAEEGRMAGAHALHLIGRGGQALVRVLLARGEAEIAPIRRGGVLCLQRLEGTQQNELTLFEADGNRRLIHRNPAERCRLSSDGETSALISLEGDVLGELAIPSSRAGPIDLRTIHLPRGPEGFEATRLADSCSYDGDWLTLEEDGVLRRVGADGAQRWAVRSAQCWGREHEAPQFLVAHDVIWLYSRRRAWIERRNPKTGQRIGPTLSGLPHGVVDSAAPWVNGGVLFAAGGAILHLNRLGRIAPGQGGLRFVTDLAATHRVSAPQ